MCNICIVNVDTERACRRCGCDGGGVFTFSYADTFYPDLELNLTLLPLGDTTVNVKAWCEVLVNCVSRRYNYSCRGTFYLHDRFTDPFDFFDIMPGEWNPGDHPYRVTARWTNDFGGSGEF
jgi:hypothetical protein